MTGPTRRQILQMAEEAGVTDPVAAERLVRLALATFGGQTPQPIPVSERLPGPGDCKAWEWNHSISDAWCWWWDDHESAWARGEADTPRPSYLTHWLPADALPLPTTTETNDD